MADTDNPNVKQFTVVEANGQDCTTVILGPEVAMITNTKWPFDAEGKIIGIGQSTTTRISRQAMIGLAYEILASVGKV